MKSVTHIFGGEAKVKIMRLFLFNPGLVCDAETVALRSQEKVSKVRKELSNLSKAGLVKTKIYTKHMVSSGGKKKKTTFRRVSGYTLNSSYPYIKALENFLIDASPITEKEIIKKLSRAGSVKLILISGIFLHDSETRVDLLVVGDHIKKGMLISAISSIEAELGKEIRYAAFETPDFKYRLGLYDKLIRDILDFPHQKILNKLGI